MTEQISQLPNHKIEKEETAESLSAGMSVSVAEPDPLKTSKAPFVPPQSSPSSPLSESQPTGSQAQNGSVPNERMRSSEEDEEQTDSAKHRSKLAEEQKLAEEDQRYFALDARIGRSLFSLLARFLSGASSSWASPPQTCQRVYYANHTSHLDILAIWSSLPGDVRRFVRPVAAKDYWSKGRIRPYIANRLFNAILLERQHVKAHQNPIDAMVHEMGDRYSIIIFPEGGRQSSGEIAEFKSGLYHICKKKPLLELVPIYIDNMNRILPRGRLLPVPLLSHVAFGEPIWLKENEKKQDFLARARQAVLDLKEQYLRRNTISEDRRKP